MSHKYSLIHEQSRGKLPLEIASVFKPKLKIYVSRNAALKGRIKKSRVQEELYACPSLHMLSRKIPPMAVQLYEQLSETESALWDLKKSVTVFRLFCSKGQIFPFLDPPSENDNSQNLKESGLSLRKPFNS